LSMSATFTQVGGGVEAAERFVSSCCSPLAHPLSPSHAPSPSHVHSITRILTRACSRAACYCAREWLHCTRVDGLLWLRAKDRDRRAVQGQKCVRCCCSCVKRRCDQVGASSAAPMRRLALGEGKSWVEDGAGWWGWGLLRGSQRDHHDHGSLVAHPQGAATTSSPQ
jgi:hypothetical protein